MHSGQKGLWNNFDTLVLYSQNMSTTDSNATEMPTVPQPNVGGAIRRANYRLVLHKSIWIATLIIGGIQDKYNW